MTLERAIAYATRGRGTSGRPAFGWESVTATEMLIVRLVTEGLTNPQVAQRMTLSPATVRTHLMHIFAKLGVSSRGELTDAARATLDLG